MSALKIGDSAARRHLIGSRSMQLFSELVGDNNPIHHDVKVARIAGFRSPIAHGMVAGSLFSEILGNELPGPGSVYASQSFKFLAPIHVGDEVELRVEIVNLQKDGRVVTVSTRCLGSDGVLCIDGEAVLIRRPVGSAE